MPARGHRAALRSGKPRTIPRGQSQRVNLHDAPLPDDQFVRDFAATRSHQDAVAANEHTKSLDQLIFVLNGAAATTILTFASRAISRDSTILVSMTLGCFAFGAASGAAAMRAHARALYEWLYFWSLRAGVGDYDQAPTVNDVRTVHRDALLNAAAHDLCYRFSIVFFLAGCCYFGIGILSTTPLASKGLPFFEVGAAIVTLGIAAALGVVIYRYLVETREVRKSARML
jgi:hypothetical protein